MAQEAQFWRAAGTIVGGQVAEPLSALAGLTSAVEAIAIEGYRTGGLTEAQVRRLLELDTRSQVHALLKEHHVPLRYTEADVEADLSAHRELGILPSR